LRSGYDKPIECVARREKSSGDVWRIVSYRRPSPTDRFELAVDGEIASGLRLASCESLTTGGGTLHVSMIAADSSPARTSSHRRPQWSIPVPGTPFEASASETRNVL
jgi:hypothetical protein